MNMGVARWLLGGRRARAATGHRGHGTSRARGVASTGHGHGTPWARDIANTRNRGHGTLRARVTAGAGHRMQVYRNIFVEHKFRKSRPCIILLYIRIDGLQNLNKFYILPVQI